MAALGVRKDPYYVSAALKLFVDAFEHIGRFEVFVMCGGIAQKRKGFFDVGL